MKSLQNNKAPGPGGFPIEYFKSFSDKLLSPLTNMIREALDNQTLPGTLELATIILLPKPDKNQQKCGSYRPLSLLNADYKTIPKLLANRLEDVMPKIIHPDQTGFIRSRQGSDNVRRLFHIVDYARKKKEPMLILSMDAAKAFDRIEPSLLFQTLERMNFGVRFIQYIKTLFKAPKAEILTDGVLLGAFSLSRGVRQGCCISSSLFSLAIEPLALAIRANTAISGVKFGTSEHKISLYADNILIYMTDPADSVPPLYQCLQEYSAVTK